MRSFVTMLACSAVLCAAMPAGAQPTAGNAPVPAPIPTPAPGGTPVTFGGSPIGQPISNTTPSPEATSVTNSSASGGPSRSYDRAREVFVTGDYLISPKVYNEYDPQGIKSGKSSYTLHGAAEFDIGNLPLMIGGDFRYYRYEHAAGNVTLAHPGIVSFVSEGTIADNDYDGHLGIKLLEPRIYLSASFLGKNIDGAGYPLVAGAGLGLEKLPDYESPLSVYFSAYYYPNLTGRFTAVGTPLSLGLHYRMFRYRAGVALAPASSPIFVDLGIIGDRDTARASAPVNEEHFGPYLGIGVYSHK